MQIGTAHIPDKERVAGEDEPRILGPTAQVGDDVRVVGRRVTRRREGTHERIAEFDPLAVGEFRVLELNWRAGREKRCRTRHLDQRGQSGDMVRLHVRLENGDDRCTRTLGLSQVVVDERLVRIDDCEPSFRQTAEEVRGASGLLVEEGSKDHSLRLEAWSTWR